MIHKIHLPEIKNCENFIRHDEVLAIDNSSWLDLQRIKLHHEKI